MKCIRHATAILALCVTAVGTAALAGQGDRLLVAADILPVHSLVASVAGDGAEVELLRDSRQDPHGHAIRPSEMARLISADLVVYVGAALEPELAARLSDEPERALPLTDVPGTRLRVSEGGAVDPHAWLAPGNARRWTEAIAAALSRKAPDAAREFARNAEAAQAAIREAEAEADRILEPVRGLRLATGHDFLGYYAESFGLTIADTLAPADDAPPSLLAAARVAAEVRAGRIDCLVVEPGGTARLPAPLRTLPTARIVEVDVVGVTLDPGPSLYPRLLRDIAGRLRRCAPH